MRGIVRAALTLCTHVTEMVTIRTGGKDKAMSRPVLKPCPSCGKEQMTDEERGDSRVPYRGRHRICDTRQCGCVMRKWNARPLEDALQAEIDRLRAQIEAMKAWIPAWAIEEMDNPKEDEAWKNL